MWERFVTIDYELLVDYLLSQDTSDVPLASLRFERFRDLLDEHLQTLMTEPNEGDPDSVLTEILFKHYWGGTVISTRVTTGPGIVVIRNGEGVILPRILIELKHTGL